MKKATIYTTQYCPHCQRAKSLLKTKKIDFEEIDLTDDQAKRDQLEAKTGWMTVPMIFIGEKFIGGSDDLHQLDQTGELDKLLKS